MGSEFHNERHVVVTKGILHLRHITGCSQEVKTSVLRILYMQSLNNINVKIHIMLRIHVIMDLVT